MWAVIVTEPRNEFTEDVHCGGQLICGSVAERYLPLILAAPELFTRLKELSADVSSGALDTESLDSALKLIKEMETP